MAVAAAAVVVARSASMPSVVRAPVAPRAGSHPATGSLRTAVVDKVAAATVVDMTKVAAAATAAAATVDKVAAATAVAAAATVVVAAATVAAATAVLPLVAATAVLPLAATVVAATAEPPLLVAAVVTVATKPSRGLAERKSSTYGVCNVFKGTKTTLCVFARACKGTANNLVLLCNA